MVKRGDDRGGERSDWGLGRGDDGFSEGSEHVVIRDPADDLFVNDGFERGREYADMDN